MFSPSALLEVGKAIFSALCLLIFHTSTLYHTVVLVFLVLDDTTLSAQAHAMSFNSCGMSKLHYLESVGTSEKKQGAKLKKKKAFQRVPMDTS